jgi:hypothetical protein
LNTKRSDVLRILATRVHNASTGGDETSQARPRACTERHEAQPEGCIGRHDLGEEDGRAGGENGDACATAAGYGKINE